MKVYLIECGRFLVLFVEERQMYFNVDEHPVFLQQFFSGPLECDQWKEGKNFKLNGTFKNEDELLKLFYDPDRNSGAVLAMRDSCKEEPEVFNRRRFSQVKSMYISQL